MNKIPTLFSEPAVNQARLDEIEAMPEPRKRYIFAMTPRSGSSYLCDVMTNARVFGAPREVMNQDFISNVMKRIPGRTADEYLRNVNRVKAARNGVSGFKASWFQFQNFTQSMQDKKYLAGFKYIYLTRRDLAAQAVSLYKATATTVFHTNKKHGEDAVGKLESLEYDYARIGDWYEHILQQEKGWQAYFMENRIFPLCITYEDIDEDVLGVMRRIATFIGVRPDKVALPKDESVFKKVGDIRNLEWARRFTLERNQPKDEAPRVSEHIEIVDRA